MKIKKKVIFRYLKDKINLIIHIFLKYLLLVTQCLIMYSYLNNLNIKII